MKYKMKLEKGIVYVFRTVEAPIVLDKTIPLELAEQTFDEEILKRLMQGEEIEFTVSGG